MKYTSGVISDSSDLYSEQDNDNLSQDGFRKPKFFRRVQQNMRRKKQISRKNN